MCSLSISIPLLFAALFVPMAHQQGPYQKSVVMALLIRPQDADIATLIQQLGLSPDMASQVEQALNEPAPEASPTAVTLVPFSTTQKMELKLASELHPGYNWLKEEERTSWGENWAPGSSSSEDIEFVATEICGRINPYDTCLDTTTDGPINQQLNAPISNGVFTFYGAGGRGACGLDIDQPKMSAAISGQLFKPDGQWVESCLADTRSLLDDPACKNVCVKIEYNDKSLTVLANNKCSECEPGHVNLSIDAFKYLEPKGGEVGTVTNATITYLKCDGTEMC